MNIDSFVYDMALEKKGDEDKPFLKKELQYIQDNNASQSYQLSQIVFDSLSLSSNGKYNDIRNSTIAIPFVLTMSTDDVLPANLDFSLAFKNSNLSFISSLQLEYNNSLVFQTQSNLNAYLTFLQHTNFSYDDEEKLGSMLGYAMDGCSWAYEPVASNKGIGCVNNVNFPIKQEPTGEAYLTCNDGMFKRQLGYSWKKVNGVNNHNSFFEISDIQNTGGNYIDDSIANVKTYYYTAILRLRDMHDFFLQMPTLIKGASYKLTINVNTCVFNITTNAYAANTGPSAGTMTLSNVSCPWGSNPVMVSAMGTTIKKNPQSNTAATAGSAVDIIVPCGNALLPANKIYTISLSIVKNNNTAHGAGKYGQTHIMKNSRWYVSTYVLIPEFEKSYLAINQKSWKYKDVLYKYVNNWTGGSSTQIVSSLVGAKRLIVIPMLASSVNGNALANIGTAGNGTSCMMSPYCTEPSTCSACVRLKNVQVFISNNPIYPQYLDYDFENFMNEMANSGIEGGLQNGLTSGRIDYNSWSSGVYGYYCFDLSRRLPEEASVGVSIDFYAVSASSKNPKPLIDLHFYIEYEKNFTINVENGSRVQ